MSTDTKNLKFVSIRTNRGAFEQFDAVRKAQGYSSFSGFAISCIRAACEKHIKTTNYSHNGQHKECNINTNNTLGGACHG